MLALLLLLPWALWLVAFPLSVRWRPRLRSYVLTRDRDLPRVSVIVPARNEAVNIGTCVATLLDTRYLDCEVVVVDDRSTDGTLEVAQALAERSDGRLRIIHGAPLPPGWVGKPWACWQGYLVARGDVLLFTDADTRHGPTLLGHAVAALEQERADMISVVPHQVLSTFWERVIMPQVLTVILARFLDARRVNQARRPRDVVANGQFILVSREAYEAVGGHESVKGEIVEDLHLAQRFAESGRRVFLGWAEDLMETRMYRSVGEIAEGWTKNLALGARASVADWLGPAVPWLIAAFLIGFWVVPPVVFIASAIGGLAGRPDTWLGWSAGVTALSVAFWAISYAAMRAPLTYVLLYPVGALAAAILFVRSTFHAGRAVHWRGRRYVAPSTSDARRRGKSGATPPGSPPA